MKEDTLDIPAIVQWQFDNHKGFYHSFIDSIAHGPIMHEHDSWKKACDAVLKNPRKDSLIKSLEELRDSNILVVFGDSDGIVAGQHVSKDLISLLGGARGIEFRTVAGGHGFPVSSPKDVTELIFEFWGI